MILFWLLCTLMIVIALAFVLPPLLQQESQTAIVLSETDRKEANVAIYKDQLAELKSDLDNGIVSQEQYDKDVVEIERRLLEDTASTDSVSQVAGVQKRNVAYAAAVAIPLAAVVFYLQIGLSQAISNPRTLDTMPRSAASAPPSMGDGERSAEQIAANVDKLAEKLKSNPNDLAGWTMLARSYSSMSKFAEAAGAYAKATELNPKDADLWAEYAFATAMANGRKMDGKVSELVEQALKVDPENAKALQLAGTIAFDAKDYKKAILTWEKVLKRVPPNSEVAQAITDRINEAKTLSASK